MKGKKGGGTVEEKSGSEGLGIRRSASWAATAAAGHGAAAGGCRPVEHVRHVKPGRRTLSCRRAPRSHAPAVRSSASQKRSSVQQVHGSAAAQV